MEKKRKHSRRPLLVAAGQCWKLSSFVGLIFLPAFSYLCTNLLPTRSLVVQ